MDRIALSPSGTAIRLTEDRWFHITESHDEMAGHASTVLAAIEAPDFIADGWEGELIAVKRLKGRHIVVVFREVGADDGFVITAFFTRDVHRWGKRNRVWPP